MDHTGRALLQGVRDGDAAALDELIRRHGPTLRRHLERYVSPADADDLLQELWLRVWQRAEQWDARGRLLGWLLAIATNLALNHLRRRRALVSLADFGDEEISDDISSALEAAIAGPEDRVIWGEQLRRVRSAMALLPPDKLEVLRLVRVENRSLRDAATALGVPIGTVKSRLHYAQRMLAEHLEDDT